MPLAAFAPAPSSLDLAELQQASAPLRACALNLHYSSPSFPALPMWTDQHIRYIAAMLLPN
jgi:hypothetical protein